MQRLRHRTTHFKLAIHGQQPLTLCYRFMKTDVLIIGGGIVGLSTGYQLLKLNENLNVTILEKEDGVAKHQTGNNSGVIHSGIYYKPGSLKAQNCLRGYWISAKQNTSITTCAEKSS